MKTGEVIALGVGGLLLYSMLSGKEQEAGNLGGGLSLNLGDIGAGGGESGIVGALSGVMSSLAGAVGGGGGGGTFIENVMDKGKDLVEGAGDVVEGAGDVADWFTDPDKAKDFIFNAVKDAVEDQLPYWLRDPFGAAEAFYREQEQKARDYWDELTGNTQPESPTEPGQPGPNAEANIKPSRDLPSSYELPTGESYIQPGNWWDRVVYEFKRGHTDVPGENWFKTINPYLRYTSDIIPGLAGVSSETRRETPELYKSYENMYNADVEAAREEFIESELGPRPGDLVVPGEWIGEAGPSGLDYFYHIPGF